MGDGDRWDEKVADLAGDVADVFDDIDDPEAARTAMQRGDFERAYEMMGLTPEEAERLVREWRGRALSIVGRGTDTDADADVGDADTDTDADDGDTDT